MRTCLTLEDVREPAADRAGDIEKGTQRPRCEKRIARPPENTDRSATLLAETADERRLAHSRLATDEYEPAAAALRIRECRSQPLEWKLPLEDRRALGFIGFCRAHVRIVSPPWVSFKRR